MNIFQRRAQVLAAQRRLQAAREQMAAPGAALLARGRVHPLTTVGAAAGAGLVLGRLNVHPLRVPGLGALLGGGLAEAVAYGVRIIAELSDAGSDRAHPESPSATSAQRDLFDQVEQDRPAS